MKYRILMSVDGALEGNLQGVVEADDMEEAREKAYEAFNNNTCRQIEEVEVEDE